MSYPWTIALWIIFLWHDLFICNLVRVYLCVDTYRSQLLMLPLLPIRYISFSALDATLVIRWSVVKCSNPVNNEVRVVWCLPFSCHLTRANGKAYEVILSNRKNNLICAFDSPTSCSMTEYHHLGIQCNGMCLAWERPNGWRGISRMTEYRHLDIRMWCPYKHYQWVYKYITCLLYVSFFYLCFILW
jgi:hypothetical protein